jgi:hypothetical protein
LPTTSLPCRCRGPWQGRASISSWQGREGQGSYKLTAGQGKAREGQGQGGGRAGNLNTLLLLAFDHTSKEEVSRYVPTGNSRSKPEPMWFYYSKAKCKFHSIYPRKVVSHRVACNGSLRNADKPFRCSEEGCNKAFPSAQTLDQHIRGIHRWLPRACTQCPMSLDAYIFQSQEELSEHRDKKHNNLPEPQRCPLAQTCLSKKQYLTFLSLSKHLCKIYLLTVD